MKGYCKFTSNHYFKGNLHRLDGPAVEFASGAKKWWKEGKRHRLDGPAAERVNGYKEWFVKGKQYSEEEFLKKTYLKSNPC